MIKVYTLCMHAVRHMNAFSEDDNLYNGKINVIISKHCWQQLAFLTIAESLSGIGL